MDEDHDCLDRVTVCSTCYALVWESYLPEHYAWHGDD